MDSMVEALEIKTYEPYDSIPYAPLNDRELNSRHGAQFFRNVKQLQVGFGAQVFRVDREGMWAGAETFADAPWSVDWEGNMVADSLSISGYIPTGGALADIGVGNITGTYIDDGAIVTDKLAANAVVASKINVSTLSAISANIGTVTAGTITGITITGGTVRTSSSGSRVQMTAASDSLEVYSGSTKRMELDADELRFYNSSGDELGYLTTPTSNNFFIGATNGNYLILESEGASPYGIIFRADGGQVMAISTLGVALSDDLKLQGNNIDMGSGEITNIDEIVFDKTTRTPNADGEMLHYDNGSNQSMRVQMDGTDYTFDLSFL